MGNLEAGNTMRIAALEKCVPKMGADIQIIDERTSVILNIVQELKQDLRDSSSASHELAIAHAEDLIRWQTYKEEKEKTSERIDAIEALARKNQLTLVKSLALTGGGGIVAMLAREFIAYFSSRSLP